jgi:hypothetical protein
MIYVSNIIAPEYQILSEWFGLDFYAQQGKTNITTNKPLGKPPFFVVPLKKTTTLQRLLGRFPSDNAVIEFNNLLALTPILDIDKHDVTYLDVKYRQTNLWKTYKRNAQEFYAVLLAYCLRDKHLDDQELADLNQLRHLVRLTEEDVVEMHHIVGQELYRRSFKEIIADGTISQEEIDFLEKLAAQVELPISITDQIEFDLKKDFFKEYIVQRTQNRKLTEEEKVELRLLSENLDFQLEGDEYNVQNLLNLRMSWALEHLDLPIFKTNETFPEGELCHLILDQVEWFVVAQFKPNTNKIIQEDSSFPPVEINQIWNLKYEGHLYLTNKQIHLINDNSERESLEFKKIISFTPYPQGILLQLVRRKSVFLFCPAAVDVFSLLLGRLFERK